jgi:hypothetical protein
MKSFILFLALVCGGVSFLVYTDNQFVSGNWAGQICRSAGALCHNPQLLAFAARRTARLVAADDFCIGDPRLDRPAGAKFLIVGAARFEPAPE